MALLHKDWWLTEYAPEIHQNMKSKEKKRKSFRGRSPQLKCRSDLLEWLVRVGEKHHLSVLAKHLALHYLDIFMDSHSIEVEQLHLVALACLLLAAKAEERDILIPKTSELNRSTNNYYKLGDFLQMEVALLEFFDWELVMPTTVHFLDYYTHFLIAPEDLEGDLKAIRTMSQGEMYGHHYVTYFLDRSVRDISFLSYHKSVVAASCLAATRICLLLTPCWPTRLQKITGYTSDHISNCTELLLSHLENDELKANSIQ